MIVKRVSKPISLIQHEILLKRFICSSSTLDEIQQNKKKIHTGYKGELSLEFFLSEWNREDGRVFFDLRMDHFQLDIFLLCKNYGVILEVKNIYGKLYFDSKHQQLLRSTSEGEQGFLYPIAQLNRQQRLFKDWLAKIHLSNLPIHGFVVIANSSTIIDSDKALPQVIHAHSLLEKLEVLDRIHKEDILQTRQLNRFTQRLLEAHQLSYGSILSKYNLKTREILIGVECCSCFSFQMKRKNRTWVCDKCGHKDKTAHLPTIREYVLLHGKNFISNREFREWTGLESIYSANKLLNRTGFLPVNEYKTRYYVVPDDFLYSLCQI